MLRSILKIVTSAKLVDILDKNGNGRVEWREIRSATGNDWLEIAGELGLTALAVFGLMR